MIGPNRTFMEYVSHVLPALGEDSVEQRAVAELVDGIEPELRDPPAVAELKADLRLAEVIQRAAELRLVSEPEELVIRLEGSFISVRFARCASCSQAPRDGNDAAARERFRMSSPAPFLRGVRTRARRRRDFATSTRSNRRSAQAATSTASSRRPGRWSRPTSSSIRCSPTARRSPKRPTASSTRTSSDCSSGRGQAWSDGDMPLLDEARASSLRRRTRYGHVIVDEAQDLTPMQLRMVARRARDGALTILGDVAQATGAITYRSWSEVLPHLPHGDEADVEELRHAYRVPREIMEWPCPCSRRSPRT